MSVPEIFGSMVFNDKVMQERLPKPVYTAVKKAVANGTALSIETAKEVAAAMKDWAIEKGATHFTHWFQPMTGITAEKHNAFIEPDGENVIMKFSEKSLVKGESDASSFPTGGLRATFEARGYTAWDPTSYAFVKDGSLYIPTAFCSYSGEALDKKTPLLRSMDALNNQALRILRLFGDDKTVRVIPTVGAEQEYFLIDRKVYEKRIDLIHCGRTLFGARPSKGQELEDHYYGAIKPRVAAFMKELDEELWKLGVPAKTKHNEAAPAQHELAPVYVSANIASDQNQLTMEIMKSVANKHGLVCLLHEKPFESVNGSGKHDNWSIVTDGGENLLEPGETPETNARFLLFLMAVIKAVDEYQDLLRISVASAGNDHRLGGYEAPPAIISIYLGEELDEILSSIESGENYNAKKKSVLKIGVNVLPPIPKDSTDRNRTSPFAFTGNKFEFRMLGSSASVSDSNIVINTAVAESLRQFADRLESAENFENELNELIRDTVKKHKRIIFNGNGYDESWVKEAESRGLSNLPSTPEAIVHYLDEKNVQLFTRHKVFSREEMESRSEIMLDNYNKLINIEARTMFNMASKDILPAVSAYSGKLAESALNKKRLSDAIDCTYEENNAYEISSLCAKAYKTLNALGESVEELKDIKENVKRAFFCKDTVISLMNDLRSYVDELEMITSSDIWPYPSVGELLYGVR